MTLLEIKDLSKSYKEVDAVKNIAFDVKKGEVLGFLGPNGAGKSTTISMISTLVKPDKGAILFKGEDIVKRPKEIQKSLGIVPQEIALYEDMSGYENMKFWGEAYGLRGKDLKNRIDVVSDVIGIGERLKDKVKKYSGGMKRRLNIGVALLHEPELLIMDEPTVGIDPQSRNHILDTVLKLNAQGMTIIYTSHYMEEVSYLCDRIHIMDEGKIIASGSQDELIDILGSQKKVTVTFDQIDNGVVSRLESIEYVDEAKVHENRIVMTTHNGEHIVQDIIEKVNGSDIKIIGLEVEKPSLESVFLHLTGKALRD